ncbi:amidohydrolase family protein [Rubinisphaera italica]|uniref:N-acyl-D-glutamate deacylase n=1 Tax=Rubinisphaera italica TaxID=2527969 RepID=A0A5C5XET3_9PLAN|nr:amidohydrolase family protein [Rubinisphaera italica]TWT60941.1 N-acyl-D-glutamate deacylase [Rubinisphaera italica]
MRLHMHNIRIGSIASISKQLHFFILAILLSSGASTNAADYDLVILNGRVMDPETKLDAVRNVGIKDGKITTITDESIQGTNSIDAKGLVVAPGFLDMHHHNVAVPFGQKLALRDGVTTPMELELGVYEVDKWYAALKGKSQSNYGVSVGTMPIRETIFNPKFKTKFAGDILYDMQIPKETRTSMAWSKTIATTKDMVRFRKMLEEGLDAGAIAIGHVPGYMVSGVTNEESTIAQQLAGKHKTFVALHGRYSSQMPPASGILGTYEMMAPQATYGGGLVVQHITAQTLADTPFALRMIDDARSRGTHVIAEIYPYDYGGTIVGADYLHPDNYQRNMKRDYKDIIEVSTLKPLTKERYEELVKTAPGTSVMFYNATEQTVYDGLAHPSTVLGSDAFAYSLKAGGPAIEWDTPYDGVNGHPRGAGAHARLLRLVREEKVDIPLMLAISKMSYTIARFMQDNGVQQMAKKGRIQVGCDADITLFDPKTVIDNSTMKNGGLPSTGIPYVIVNGTVVVKDSKVLKGVYPGQPVRRAIRD